MATKSSDWTAERMYELGTRHADLEARGKLDELMATLVEDPVYEFHPAGLRMTGRDRVRRYYAQFIEHFIPMTAGYTLLEEWASEKSVGQEYEIVLRVDGKLETHRVVGILYAAVSDDLLIVRLVQAVFGSLACVLLALTAARFLSSRTAGIASFPYVTSSRLRPRQSRSRSPSTTASEAFTSTPYPSCETWGPRQRSFSPATTSGGTIAGPRSPHRRRRWRC